MKLQKIKLGIKDFGSHEINPFEIKGVKKVFKKYKGVPVVNPETGEYYNLVPSIPDLKIVKDVAEYRKVYVESISTIKDFSIAALKVWTFILMNLKINNDEVVCDLEAIKLFTGYKTNIDIYKGLVELMEKKFIARKQSYKSVYFVNSNLMFNGKRVN